MKSRTRSVVGFRSRDIVLCATRRALDAEVHLSTENRTTVRAIWWMDRYTMTYVVITML